MPKDYSGLGEYGPYTKRGRKPPPPKPLDVTNPPPPAASIRTPPPPHTRPPKEPRKPSYWRAWSKSQEDMWTDTVSKRARERGRKGGYRVAQQRAEERRLQAQEQEQARTLAEEQEHTAQIREQGYAERVVPAQPELPDEKPHPYWRRIGGG